MMNNKVVYCGLVALCGAGAMLSLSGCGQNAHASTPAGSFRMTVEELFSDDSTQVERVTVETEGNGYFDFDAMPGGHTGTSIKTDFDPQPGEHISTATLTFVADVVATPGSPGHSILRLAEQVSVSGAVSKGTVTWPVSDKSRGSGPLLGELKSGMYPFGTVLQIGPLCGKPVTLTVSAGR